ncbi:MAG: hypothetical protein KAI66_13340 [Lentisphaeria bacterium]|nr:hypothetical protein [Lentisphaeria bacterium]
MAIQQVMLPGHVTATFGLVTTQISDAISRIGREVRQPLMGRGLGIEAHVGRVQRGEERLIHVAPGIRARIVLAHPTRVELRQSVDEKGYCGIGIGLMQIIQHQGPAAAVGRHIAVSLHGRIRTGAIRVDAVNAVFRIASIDQDFGTVGRRHAGAGQAKPETIPVFVATRAVAARRTETTAVQIGLRVIL